MRPVILSLVAVSIAAVVVIRCSGKESSEAGSLPPPLSVPTKSGTFLLEAVPQGEHAKQLGIIVRINPKLVGEPINIGDQAAAFSRFFQYLEKHGIPSAQIVSVYLPAARVKEVEARIAIAAGNSPRWLVRKPDESNELLADLIMTSNVYSEIAEVLKQRQLEIEKVTIEKVVTSIGTTRVEVPVMWTTFWTLKKRARP